MERQENKVLASAGALASMICGRGSSSTLGLGGPSSGKGLDLGEDHCRTVLQ